MRRLKLVLAPIPMSIALWVACSYLMPGGREKQSPNPASRRTESFSVNQVYAGGIVEGARREISLQFEIAGRIEKINVREGDRVEKGSVLAELDAGLWELRLADAGAQLKLARAERERLTSASRIPVRSEDLAIADSKVELAEGAVRRERFMLEKVELRAPTQGIVLRVRGEPGELAGPGVEVLAIVNRDVTRVRAYVEELDTLNVVPGQRAVVTADVIPGRPFQGNVRSCSPWVGPKSQRHLKPGEMFDVHVREVLIDLADGGDLLIGLPVDVLISLDEPKLEDLESPSRSRERLSAVPSPRKSVPDSQDSVGR